MLPCIIIIIIIAVSSLITVAAATVFYLYKPLWGVWRIPGPPAFPLLGHLPLLAKHGPDVFAVLAKRYGPVFRFHMGRQPLVVIADAELCREVGIQKFKYIPNRSIPSPISASPLHQKGLFFSRDSRWSVMRNIIISMYQPSHLATLIPTMQHYIESAAQHLLSFDEDEDIDFSNLSLKLATDVIGQAAFGFDFGLSKPPNSASDAPGTLPNDDDHNKETSDFISQHVYSTTTLKMDLSGSLSIIVGLLVPMLQEPFRQVLKRIPGTMDWKVEKTDKKLSTRLDEIVAKRKEKNMTSRDFLSLILNARRSEEKMRNLLTSDYVSALTYEHLLAGSATTAFTLSSVVYLVAGHPKVEEKLLDEIDGFGSRGKQPTAHELQFRFPYLDQVIKEAMRFYTVSPLIAREVAASVEIGGYLLKKGAWVWLAPGVLAKDAKNFSDPEKFRPERFHPENEEEKSRHPYAHIPFGIGPRACIGQRFALQEIKLSVIHLYRKYTFRHSPNMEKPLELEYSMVLNYKHGVKLRATRREQNQAHAAKDHSRSKFKLTKDSSAYSS